MSYTGMPSRTMMSPGQGYGGFLANTTTSHNKPITYKYEDGHQAADQHTEDDVVQELAVAAGDAEDAGPDHLHHQRNRRRLAAAMQAGNAAKEKAILGHGVIDAGAGENQAVAAAKAGNHDGHGHQRAANRTEHLRNDRSGDAVFAGILNSALDQRCTGRTAHQRQRPQINKIARDVERDDHAGADRQGQ